MPGYAARDDNVIGNIHSAMENTATYVCHKVSYICGWKDKKRLGGTFWQHFPMRKKNLSFRCILAWIQGGKLKCGQMCICIYRQMVTWRDHGDYM